MTKNIFISYAYQDKQYLEQIIDRLRKEDFIKGHESLILDHTADFGPDSNIREMIQRRIQEASKVFVLWTEESAKSQYVYYEIGMAKALNKEIIILATKKTLQKLPITLMDIKFVDIENYFKLTKKEDVSESFDDVKKQMLDYCAKEALGFYLVNSKS